MIEHITYLDQERRKHKRHTVLHEMDGTRYDGRNNVHFHQITYAAEVTTIHYTPIHHEKYWFISLGVRGPVGRVWSALPRWA